MQYGKCFSIPSIYHPQVSNPLLIPTDCRCDTLKGLPVIKPRGGGCKDYKWEQYKGKMGNDDSNHCRKIWEVMT